MTAALRASARARGDADSFHLWAGQGYPLAEAVPAAELVDQLAEQARTSLRAAIARVGTASSADVAARVPPL